MSQKDKEIHDDEAKAPDEPVDTRYVLDPLCVTKVFGFQNLTLFNSSSSIDRAKNTNNNNKEGDTSISNEAKDSVPIRIPLNSFTVIDYKKKDDEYSSKEEKDIGKSLVDAEKEGECLQ